MSKFINAISLLVPGYDVGLKFYVDVMNFELLENTDLGNGKRWVIVSPSRKYPTNLLLARAATEEQRSSIGKQCGGRVFLFLQTDNFMDDYTRMRAAGVYFEEEPRHEPYGIVAVFQDPFGNRWDLLERR